MMSHTEGWLQRIELRRRGEAMNDGDGKGRTGILRQLAELDTLPTDTLKNRWRALHGTDPPRFNRQFLVKRLAYRIQEIAYGGLPDAARARLNELLGEEGYDAIGVKVADRRPHNRNSKDHPVPGTVMIREWDGERHEVTALRKGFEYRGIPYRSLSAVARKITGTQWNGPLFFGLRDGPVRRDGAEASNGQK